MSGSAQTRTEDLAGEARAAAEQAARASYGRLLAFLVARTRDVAAAEDALAEAFRIALETWPQRGVPEKPEAWLLTAARSRLGHDWRHRGVAAAAAGTLELIADERQEAEMAEIPDDRLKLLFACAHPEIDAAVRTPLMLQTVLGLDAARVAGCFLVSPAAMGQRLVRAKAKLRDGGIPFDVPGRDELAPRLEAVLSAIYAAFGTGWDDGVNPAAGVAAAGLDDEAIFLGRLVVALLPAEPEARGLLALMLHCEARRAARRDAAGAYVPLSEQDPADWSAPLIQEAEAQLMVAANARRPGRFQLEAAIQSLHAGRAAGRPVDPALLAALYDGLVHVSPTIGARVGRAVAHGDAFGPLQGLALLDAMAEAAEGYQPFWAARAHLLAAASRGADAAAAYAQAAGLTDDAAVRAFLLARRARLAS